MPPGLTLIVTFEILHEQWTWPHQAHLAAQDIDEFWQFIQRSGSQPLAECREPIDVRKKLAFWSASIGHGPELDQRKWLAAISGPSLPKEDRAAEPNSDDQGQSEKNWNPERRKKENKDDIEGALPKTSIRGSAHVTALVAVLQAPRRPWFLAGHLWSPPRRRRRNYPRRSSDSPEFAPPCQWSRLLLLARARRE